VAVDVGMLGQASAYEMAFDAGRGIKVVSNSDDNLEDLEVDSGLKAGNNGVA